MMHNISRNDTRIAADDPETPSFWEQVFWLVVTIIIMLTILLANGLVMASVVISKKLRERLSNYFILNLSVADFCCSLFMLPFMMFSFWYGRFPFGHFLCSFNMTLNVGLSAQSAYGTMLVSLDKFIFVIYPLHYHRLITPVRVRLAIASTWGLSFLVAGFGCLTRWAEKSNSRFRVYPPGCFAIKTEYISAVFILTNLVPVSVIAYTSFHVFRAIRQQAKKISPATMQEPPPSAPKWARPRNSNSPNALTVMDVEMGLESEVQVCEVQDETTPKVQDETTPKVQDETTPKVQDETTPNALTNGRPKTRLKSALKQTSQGVAPKTHARKGRKTARNQIKFAGNGARLLNKTEIRAIKGIGLIIMTLFIMWSPFFIVLSVASFCRDCDVSRLLKLTIMIAFCNSALNPLLYAKNKDFRQAYGQIVGHLCPGSSVLQKSSDAFSASVVTRANASTLAS